MIKRQLWAIIFSVGILGGCASNQAVEQQAQSNADPRDPIESINRDIWYFNYEILDEHILRPVTVAYVDYVPSFARTGLLNAATNLEEPSNTINNALQGKLDGTLISLGRFLVNSTVGIFGLFDVASEMGLGVEEEEFGEVLGVYGADTGAYLMIPGMGPSDIRSVVGDVVDSSYFPLADLTLGVSVLRTSIKALEARAQLMEQEELLNSAIDPYVFVKDAYFQRLQFKVTDGKILEEEPEDDIDIDALLDDL